MSRYSPYPTTAELEAEARGEAAAELDERIGYDCTTRGRTSAPACLTCEGCRSHMGQ